MSDKTFKETIKDVEMTSIRSTAKEGYLTLDPSKPLPHEFEEGKLSRYNENARPKFATAASKRSDYSGDGDNSSYEIDPSEGFVFNKTEFRQLLMLALSNDARDAEHEPQMIEIDADEPNEPNEPNEPTLMAPPSLPPPPPQPPQESDANEADDNDIVHINQTIEKLFNANLISDKASLESPEVDKLLNGGI